MALGAVILQQLIFAEEGAVIDDDEKIRNRCNAKAISETRS